MNVNLLMVLKSNHCC